MPHTVIIGQLGKKSPNSSSESRDGDWRLSSPLPPTAETDSGGNPSAEAIATVEEELPEATSGMA